VLEILVQDFAGFCRIFAGLQDYPVQDFLWECMASGATQCLQSSL